MTKFLFSEISATDASVVIELLPLWNATFDMPISKLNVSVLSPKEKKKKKHFWVFEISLTTWIWWKHVSVISYPSPPGLFLSVATKYTVWFVQLLKGTQESDLSNRAGPSTSNTCQALRRNGTRVVSIISDHHLITIHLLQTLLCISQTYNVKDAHRRIQLVRRRYQAKKRGVSLIKWDAHNHTKSFSEKENWDSRWQKMTDCSPLFSQQWQLPLTWGCRKL